MQFHSCERLVQFTLAPLMSSLLCKFFVIRFDHQISHENIFCSFVSPSSVFPLSNSDSGDNPAQPLPRPHPQQFHVIRRTETVWREVDGIRKLRGESLRNMRESRYQSIANRGSKIQGQAIAAHRNGIPFQDLSQQSQGFLLA